MSKVVIIIGSRANLEWAKRITNSLHNFDVGPICRIASAHKVPAICYDIIKEQEKHNPVFITIAGMSNALSGFSDAQTHCPVIACPPIGDSFGGADIYSSLRMPSGVAPMVILNPENAALAAAKIFALRDEQVRAKVVTYQEKQRQKLVEANEALNGCSE